MKFEHLPTLLTHIARQERARADQYRRAGKHRARAKQADEVADECIEARRILERSSELTSDGASE